MSGFALGIVILAFVAAGPQERAVSLPEEGRHGLYVVRVVSSPWDHGKQQIRVARLGHSEQVVYEGPWKGEKGDFDGMVREARRR
jgi:hypothetical protein